MGLEKIHVFSSSEDERGEVEDSSASIRAGKIIRMSAGAETTWYVHEVARSMYGNKFITFQSAKSLD